MKKKFIRNGKDSSRMTENSSTHGEVKDGFIQYSEEEVERWDKEWLNYLLKEYPCHLAPYH
jgi:hypothetical protein